MGNKIIFRIDDYPTGVKKIIDNRLILFDIVLSEFEKRQIKYVIGVVPKLVDKDDIFYLKTLKYAEIAVHGYDHNYFVWNGQNNNEFFNQPKDTISLKIDESIQLLKDFKIDWFIPPFNKNTQNLVDVLEEKNIKNITIGPEYFYQEGGNVNFKNLNVHSPQYYGKSSSMINEINFNNIEGQICFHLTWEIDEYKNDGINWKLPKILDKFLSLK